MQDVVLGAGPLGVAVAFELAARGRDAALVSVMGNPAYDMPEAGAAVVGGTDVAQLAKVCRGAEVIYLCLNAHFVDWHTLYRPRLAAAMDVAESLGATLVYHDNVYMYGKVAGEFTEETPYAAATRKGRLRADMATTFTEAVHAGRIRGVIGRSADMYGPGALNSSFNSTLGQRHFYPLLEGRPVSVLGDVDAPHTYAYVDDVARGLISLASDEAAIGEVWHIPSAPTLSHRELLTVAFGEAGLAPKIRGSKLSGYFVRALGRFRRDVGEVAETLYQFERPFVVAHGKYDQAFGSSPTPHAAALRTTLDWYKRHPLDSAT